VIGEKIGAALHIKKCRRVESMQENCGEAMQVLKGTNRRVVVVRSPDEKIFEQAIFIVRDDYLRKEKNSAEKLLDEARRTADEYMRKNGFRIRRKPRIPKPLYGAAALIAAGLTWLAVRFAGVLF